MSKGSSNPWGKFFWNDYESDPSLRACSLAAQGLWMRMLCLAAKATPVGYVKIGSEPCTAQDLARLVGESEETVTALLGELERRGVFSRTRTGTVYNRRMVADAKRSETNSENGRKGGEASVRKQKGIFQSPKRDDEPPPKRSTEPHKPRARNQNIPPKSPQGGTGNDDGILAHGKSRSTWRLLLIGYRDNRLWPITAGPQPFEPGCYAPDDLVAEILEPEDV